MTLANPRASPLVGRLGVLTLLAAVLFVFSIVPSAMRLDGSGTELWYVVGWTVSSFSAGLAAWRAAAMSDASARKAWRSFSLGCFSWMAATLTWAGYGWVGAVLPFPSAADAFYIGTSVMFIIGLYHYSLPGSGGGRVQVTNFALAITSAVAIGLVMYLPVLAESQLGWFGAFVAFLYPALWLGTCAFGLTCYCLYVPARDSFPLLLILGATGAHAFGDFFYGFDVLNESYAVGTFYDTSWIARFALMTWAALEHRPARGVLLEQNERASAAVNSREAFVPALAVAAILSAGVAAEWHHFGTAILVVLPIILGVGALLAIRERSLFAIERSLRDTAEQGAMSLAESEKRLSGVLEHTTDGVIVLDREFRITYANPNAIATHFADLPYLGLPMWESLDSSPDNEFYTNYRAALARQTPMRFEAYSVQSDLWFEDHVFPTPDGLTIFFRDVTERRRLREELVRLAQHDPLTGLANRTLFGERLDQGLQSGRRHRDLILVLIDLDGFKEVNDCLGHLAGDSLLQQFAGMLTSLARHGDTVARFGGDEFAIVQPGPTEPEGGAEVARRILEALRTPFDIYGTDVMLGASIGIAMAPAHGTGQDELIRSADLALYRAKRTKGAGLNYCIFEPDLDECQHVASVTAAGEA